MHPLGSPELLEECGQPLLVPWSVVQRRVEDLKTTPGDDTPIVPTPVLHPVPVLEVEPPLRPESHRKPDLWTLRSCLPDGTER